MFISACEIICTSRADKCLWSPTCQYTCSFRAVAPAALAETNTTDQQTWKSCKLSARRPRQIFKLDTTANSNSGLETVVFSQFVTVLNHDSVCVCVCVCACRPLLSLWGWWWWSWWWACWRREPQWSPSVTVSPPSLLGWSPDSPRECSVFRQLRLFDLIKTWKYGSALF